MNTVHFTNSHQLPAEGRDGDDRDEGAGVCEHGGKQERGGSPSLTVSRGELENRKVEEEHVKRHRERGGKRCGADFKRGVINFQRQRGLVLSWRDMDALSHPDN